MLSAFLTPHFAIPTLRRHQSQAGERRRPIAPYACVAARSTTARARLVELLTSEPAVESAAVDAATTELLEAAQSAEVAPGWETAVAGRWRLRYTTEPPLANMLERGLFPLGSAARSYQLFRVGGVVENVIEFSGYGDRGLPAVLSVKAEYIPRDNEQGFDFRFQRTQVQYGRAARLRIDGVEDDAAASSRFKGVNLDVTLNWAVGSGFVELVWLDHALRIDRSMLGGREVINVYVYEGPVEKCSAKRQESSQA